MRTVSVSEVRELPRRGRMVPTGIWKVPVEGRRAVRGVNLEGDEQYDRKVHGGPDKALYAYAREDIDWWETELGRELPDATFGENLTLEGVDVTGAEVGERWRIGSALLEVSEPRFPCWKLQAKLEEPRFVKRFAQALRPGAYLRIAEEGELGAGDAVEIAERPGHGVTIGLMARAYLEDHTLAARLLDAPALGEGWRRWAEARAAA